MDTVMLVFTVVLFRLFLFSVRNMIRENSGNLFLFVLFLTILVCALPMALIEKEVLDNSVINVLIGGFSFFYFPFVVGKMSSKVSE